jgi:hypothetical protein
MTNETMTKSAFLALVDRCAVAYRYAQLRGNPAFAANHRLPGDWAASLSGFHGTEALFGPEFSARRYEQAKARVEAAGEPDVEPSTDPDTITLAEFVALVQRWDAVFTLGAIVAKERQVECSEERTVDEWLDNVRQVFLLEEKLGPAASAAFHWTTQTVLAKRLQKAVA